MTEPSPSILAEAERLLNREALEEALQAAWNDFCSDTGCFPDCFSMTKKELWADFRKGPFANEVALHLSRAVAAALQAKQDQFTEHTKAVSTFLGELMAIYDPCEDADAVIPVKDTCATLLLHATTSRQFAYDQDAKLHARDERIKVLEAALEFYADPDTYFAVSMFGDSPCGDIVRDVSDCPEPWGEMIPRCGAKARTALNPVPASTGGKGEAP